MNTENCHRCKKPTNGTFTFSWFIDEVLICNTGEDNCYDKERELRNKLRERDTKAGKEITAICPYEGCGHIPKI